MALKNRRNERQAVVGRDGHVQRRPTLLPFCSPLFSPAAKPNGGWRVYQCRSVEISVPIGVAGGS